jgi:hypothetical protein
MIEYCVCSHGWDEHCGWEGEPTGCTYEVEIAHGSVCCPCSEFKLDNLRYVEDLAKSKHIL